MNIFGVQSHLYKKIGGDSIALIFVIPNRAGNRYDIIHIISNFFEPLYPEHDTFLCYLLLLCIFKHTLDVLYIAFKLFELINFKYQILKPF